MWSNTPSPPLSRKLQRANVGPAHQGVLFSSLHQAKSMPTAPYGHNPLLSNGLNRIYRHTGTVQRVSVFDGSRLRLHPKWNGRKGLTSCKALRQCETLDMYSPTGRSPSPWHGNLGSWNSHRFKGSTPITDS